MYILSFTLKKHYFSSKIRIKGKKKKTGFPTLKQKKWNLGKNKTDFIGPYLGLTNTEHKAQKLQGKKNNSLPLEKQLAL